MPASSVIEKQPKRKFIHEVACRFVEMLISQHAVHLQAVRDLYRRCVTREGFPGSPLQESVQGYPGTHAILDRLGLIKHAEETIEDPQKVLADIVDYLKSLDTPTPECLDCAESTDTSDTTISGEVSPEPSTPKEAFNISIPFVNFSWPGTSDDRRLCHTYGGPEPLQQQQQQQQHVSIAKPVSVDDTLAFRGNFSPSEVPVLWNDFPSQLRFMPAATDACQRAGLPTDMSWPAMAGHPSTSMPVGSRDNASDASLYTTDQTYFPGLFGYMHLYSTSSS
ncbi:hypothetical protein UA08_08626 [Talaromyces atroroseus]|uniref:Uncharacterized protein n=1 Tax=Talaromyces atroroseus TaxID=1441469 RepID=A0A225AB28_TALAT|nr:hypothetical protein UA08_08626 [Talaromyces atroroseus]OKL55943.1 hypothetical protein UA08_08626 [Talaromyces atroroseus]